MTIALSKAKIALSKSKVIALSTDKLITLLKSKMIAVLKFNQPVWDEFQIQNAHGRNKHQTQRRN